MGLARASASRNAVLPLSFLPTRQVTSGSKRTTPESSMLLNFLTNAEVRSMSSCFRSIPPKMASKILIKHGAGCSRHFGGFDRRDLTRRCDFGDAPLVLDQERIQCDPARRQRVRQLG